MVLLVLGLVLWWGAHLFKHVAPGPRLAIGDAGKAAVAVAVVASVVLMVIGYRAAEYVPLWEPPAFLRHVNRRTANIIACLYLYSVVFLFLYHELLLQ